MAYRRLVSRPGGGRYWEDFTVDETADKDALEQTARNNRTDDFARRLRRAQAIRRLKVTAAGTGQSAAIAADMLRLVWTEYTDADPGDPTT
jgi:hypothetical protein